MAAFLTPQLLKHTAPPSITGHRLLRDIRHYYTHAHTHPRCCRGFYVVTLRYFRCTTPHTTTTPPTPTVAPRSLTGCWRHGSWAFLRATTRHARPAAYTPAPTTRRGRPSPLHAPHLLHTTLHTRVARGCAARRRKHIRHHHLRFNRYLSFSLDMFVVVADDMNGKERGHVSVSMFCVGLTTHLPPTTHPHLYHTPHLTHPHTPATPPPPLCPPPPPLHISAHTPILPHPTYPHLYHYMLAPPTLPFVLQHIPTLVCGLDLHSTHTCPTHITHSTRTRIFRQLGAPHPFYAIMWSFYSSPSVIRFVRVSYRCWTLDRDSTCWRILF